MSGTSVADRLEELTKKYPEDYIQNDLSAKIAAIKQNITELEGEAEKLVGFEADRKKELDNAVKALKEDQARYEKRLEVLTQNNFPRLVSFDPFTWRNKDGWPSFAILSPGSPEATLRTVYDWGYHLRSVPKVPDEILGCYNDVLAKLVKHKKRHPGLWGSSTQVTLKTRYNKVILPDETREMISQTQTVFGDDNTYLIAEADEWQIGSIVERPQIGCPFVAGWNGHELFITHRFDLTPMESAMEEFIV